MKEKLFNDIHYRIEKLKEEHKKLNEHRRRILEDVKNIERRLFSIDGGISELSNTLNIINGVYIEEEIKPKEFIEDENGI